MSVLAGPAASPVAAQHVSDDELPPPVPVSLGPALIAACLAADPKGVAALLAQGADPSFSCGASRADAALISSTPLSAVSRAFGVADPSRIADVARLLLANGARLESTDQVDLAVGAVEHDCWQILDVLLSAGADLAPLAFGLMCIAIARQSVVMVAALRNRGIDPNVRDARGVTSIWAWCTGELDDLAPQSLATPDLDAVTDFVRRLVECGVYVDAVDGVGATPLMRALVAKRTDVAKALIANGARTDVRLRSGVSALHLAAVCAGPEFLRFLAQREIPLRDLKRLAMDGLQPDVRASIAAIDRKSVV